MGDIYIGCRLVSAKAAKQHFEVFEWLIENFSEKLGLPNARLYPLSESELLASVPQGADDMPEDWIQKQFANLKNYSHMDQWPISFSPSPETKPSDKRKADQKYRLLKTRQPANKEDYFIGEFGHPVFYYEPEKIDQPGYINMRIINKLAHMLHKSAAKPETIKAYAHKDLAKICGAFLGFGHIFCAQRAPRRKLLSRKPEGFNAAFSLAVYFQLFGLGYSHMKEIHGKYLSKRTMSELSVAYRQLRFYRSEINVLRGLLLKGEEMDIAS